MSEKKPETHKLKFPIPHGETKITELTLRRPKAKDMIAMEAAQARGVGNAGATIAFLAALNGLPAEVLEEMDAEDMLEFAEKVVGFLPEKFLREMRGQ